MVFFCALTLGLLFAFAYVRSYVRDFGIEKEVRALEVKQATLEKNRLELSAMLKKVQNNSFVEAQAREQLGLHKPGEKTVVVQDSASPSSTDANSPKNIVISLSNSQKWWHYFFGRPQ